MTQHPGISDEIAGRLFATCNSGEGKPFVKIECQSLDDAHKVYANLDRLRSGHVLTALSQVREANGSQTPLEGR